MPDEVGTPEEWLKRAEDDFITARLAIQVGAPGGPVTLLIQQACEKYLKGYLISKGWSLKKTHDLEILISEASRYDHSFAQFLAFSRLLSAYYLADRYPPIPRTQYPKEGISEMLEQAEKLISLIKERTV